MDKKIVIIGANDFQKPLIQKAGEMGYETHVFAWRDGATGARYADHFYDISITEHKKILKECERIKPQAVATIGSDLANITVQYLAEKLGLPGNSRECICCSTNKYAMRQAMKAAGVSVPYFQVTDGKETEKITVPSYPVIVKPTDRSGSRAITRVERHEDLQEAVRNAIDQSFEKKAIIEEYLSGQEYSMEAISYEGTHTCLAVTKKFTTGDPHYIEIGHLQPAPLEPELKEKIIKEIFCALDALKIRNGASHSEFRVDEKGKVHIIETVPYGRRLHRFPSGTSFHRTGFRENGSADCSRREAGTELQAFAEMFCHTFYYGSEGSGNIETHRRKIPSECGGKGVGRPAGNPSGNRQFQPFRFLYFSDRYYGRNRTDAALEVKVDSQY